MVYFYFGVDNGNDDASPAVRRIRELLHLSGQREFPVVTGPTEDARPAIQITTRSLLGILSGLSAEIDVPQEDIRSGATKPATALIGGETRPVLKIRSDKAPGDCYAKIRYRSRTFWIANDDFDTKYALTVVQSLAAVAETTETSRAPIVTVPAR